MSTRDEIRSKFFANKAKSKAVTLASGAEVEVRQPKVGAQLDLATMEDPKARMLRMFVDNVFVPGTDEKVFEEQDYEVLREQPAAGDYQTIMTALTSLMDLKLATDEAAKN